MPPSMNARIEGALMGACAADSAAVASTWVYGEGVLVSKLKEAGKFEEPEFVDPPLNPFYHLPKGAATCYWDQAECILTCLAARNCGAQLNFEDLFERLKVKFGKGSEYDIPRSKELMPIKGKWRNASVTKTLDKLSEGKGYPECGSDDTQIDCCIRVIPAVVSFYINNPSENGKISGDTLEALVAFCEPSVRVLQNTDTTLAFGLGFAIILYRCLSGDAPFDAMKATLDYLGEHTILEKYTSLSGDVVHALEEGIFYGSKQKISHEELMDKIGKS